MTDEKPEYVCTFGLACQNPHMYVPVSVRKPTWRERLRVVRGAAFALSIILAECLLFALAVTLFVWGVGFRP